MQKPEKTNMIACKSNKNSGVEHPNIPQLVEGVILLYNPGCYHLIVVWDGLTLVVSRLVG